MPAPKKQATTGKQASKKRSPTLAKKVAAKQKIPPPLPEELQHFNVKEDLLDTADTIQFLKCSKTTLYNRRKDETLTWIPLGGRVYYIRQDLVKLLLTLRRRGIPNRKKRK